MATGKQKLAAADGSEDDGRKYRAPALEKGLDVLELLASHGGPLTTSQMATLLGRSVSELFRMVLALEYRGYIALAEGREGYELTNKLFALGMAQTANRTLLDAALPIMNDLSRAIGQSCHLAVLSGDQVVVVARIESPRDLGFSVRVGYRRPMMEVASGAVLFGHQSGAEQELWRERLSADQDPERLASLVAKAQAAARDGLLRSPSNFVDGVTDLCVPVLGAQGAVATLNVPFIISNPLPASVEEAVERLRDASARIAEQLNGD